MGDFWGNWKIGGAVDSFKGDIIGHICFWAKNGGKN
jgi:hypothetical protein